MDDIKCLSTIEEIRGFSDPYRLRILNCFYKRHEPATVKQIADDMGEVPANVHYHVKKMEKVGILKLVYTKEINGIIAKYYEPTAKRFDILHKNEVYDPQVLSETQKVVSKLYDESKRIFIENTQIESELKAGQKGILSMEDMYLTAQEAQDFFKYIAEYMEKNSVKNRNKTEDIIQYNMFFSMIAVNDKKKK